jgi:hypothetical protein
LQQSSSNHILPSLSFNLCRYVGADNVGGRPPAPLAAELPAGLLSWIRPVWCYPEPEVIDLCGLDVAVFFRLMQLGEYSKGCSKTVCSVQFVVLPKSRGCQFCLVMQLGECSSTWDVHLANE